MQLIPDSVLVLKSQEINPERESDNYVSMLNANNIHTKFLKVLVFENKNLNLLYDKLQNPDNYNGIIFTSPRAIQATSEALKGQNLNSRWNQNQNYVIGEKSWKLVIDLLNLDCLGKDSGNALNLAEIINIDESKKLRPFLFPCGNIKRDVLKNELNRKNILLDEVTVYETISNPNLNSDFRELTENFSKVPEIFAYFSPSGVHSTKNFVEEYQLNNKIKFVAIGPTTAEEIKKIGWTLHGFAEKPTPESLLKVINDILNK